MAQAIPPPLTGSDTGLASNLAAGLCAVFHLIGGIIFYFIEKKDLFVRHWAVQTIYFGVAWIGAFPCHHGIIGDSRAIFPASVLSLSCFLACYGSSSGSVERSPLDHRHHQGFPGSEVGIPDYIATGKKILPESVVGQNSEVRSQDPGTASDPVRLVKSAPSCFRVGPFASAHAVDRCDEI